VGRRTGRNLSAESPDPSSNIAKPICSASREVPRKKSKRRSCMEVDAKEEAGTRFRQLNFEFSLCFDSARSDPFLSPSEPQKSRPFQFQRMESTIRRSQSHLSNV